MNTQDTFVAPLTSFYNRETAHIWESMEDPKLHRVLAKLDQATALEILEPQVKTQKTGSIGRKYDFDRKEKTFVAKGAVRLPSVTTKNAVRDARIRVQKRERAQPSTASLFVAYTAKCQDAHGNVWYTTPSRMLEIERLRFKGRLTRNEMADLQMAAK